MMCFIHKDGVKSDFLKQANWICDSYKPLGIEVDFRVVASAHFAETRKVWSELVQQGS